MATIGGDGKLACYDQGMLIAYLPLLIAIIGLLMFALAPNAKVQRIGEHMMWTGLLVTLFTVAKHTVRLF